MSRRYGRNQKRQHKDEIARLNKAYEMADGLSKWLSNELEAAKGTITEMLTIIESVCPNSVAIPPKKVEGTGPMNYYRVGVTNIASTDYVIGDADYICPTASFRTIDLFMPFNLFNPYVRKYAKELMQKRKLPWWRIKLHIHQTLRALPCTVLEHVPYQPEHDEPEMACKRCREYIKA